MYVVSVLGTHLEASGELPVVTSPLPPCGTPVELRLSVLVPSQCLHSLSYLTPAPCLLTDKIEVKAWFLLVSDLKIPDSCFPGFIVRRNRLCHSPIVLPSMMQPYVCQQLETLEWVGGDRKHGCWGWRDGSVGKLGLLLSKLCTGVPVTSALLGMGTV